MSVIGGILLTVIGIIGAETFLKMTNCPQSLMSEATLYFKLYFYGMPFLMIYNFCAAILRAAGDTKSPMHFLILGGVIKIVFTLLLAAVFGMRVEGVGIATVISNIVISMLGLNALKDIECIDIDFKKLRLYSSERVFP